MVFFFLNHVRGVYDCFSTSYALFILALHSRDGGKGRGGKYLMYSIKYILNVHNVECTISASSKFQKWNKMGLVVEKLLPFMYV